MAVGVLDDELRLEEERRFAKGGGGEPLLRLQMGVPLGALEAGEEAPRGLLGERGYACAFGAFFELARLDLLQKRDDVLAGAIVEGGGRACAAVGLDALPRLVEAHAHLVDLRAFDGCDVDRCAGAAQEVRDAPILEVAAALAVRHIVGQGVYGGVLEQDDLSFAHGVRLC